MIMKIIYTIMLWCTIQPLLVAQSFTRQDTLRGSITPERAWWDLRYYDLAIDVDIDKKFISGTNTIFFKVLSPQAVMQIDLQEPLVITQVEYKGQSLGITSEGNVYWIRFPYPLVAGSQEI